jgi:hypothetical protein
MTVDEIAGVLIVAVGFVLLAFGLARYEWTNRDRQ